MTLNGKKILKGNNPQQGLVCAAFFSDVQTVADQVRTLHVSKDNCVGTIHGAGFGEP